MLGSAAYAKNHKRVKQEKLLINLDCVGVGESVLFFAPKKVRESPLWQQLQQAVTPRAGKTVAFYPMEKALYPSDQANFTHGVAVCACKTGRRIGYYCDKIHTRHDTWADGDNIALIARGLAAMADRLQGE